MLSESSGGQQVATADLVTVLALRRIRTRRGYRTGPCRSFLATPSNQSIRVPGAAAAPAPTAAARPVPRRVLCTDREARVSESLVRSIRRAGFDARGCADGALALVEVTEFRPHACVLDLEAPGIGGHELARWVRSAVGGFTLLIGVADQTGDEVDHMAAEAGFDLVLCRPADSELVIGLLGGHVLPDDG